MLNHLQGFEKIGTHKIYLDETDTPLPKNHNIVILPKQNTIMFKLQNRPIGEIEEIEFDLRQVEMQGVEPAIKLPAIRGCDIDQVIEVAKVLLVKMNEAVPCHYNEGAIEGLELCLRLLQRRRLDRSQREVEGTNKV